MEIVGAAIITFFNLFTIWYKMKYAPEAEEGLEECDEYEEEVEHGVDGSAKARRDCEQGYGPRCASDSDCEGKPRGKGGEYRQLALSSSDNNSDCGSLSPAKSNENSSFVG